jgi:hypothetical protein
MNWNMSVNVVGKPHPDPLNTPVALTALDPRLKAGADVPLPVEPGAAVVVVEALVVVGAAGWVGTAPRALLPAGSAEGPDPTARPIRRPPSATTPEST